MAFLEAGRSLGSNRGAHLRSRSPWKMRPPPENPPHESLQKRMHLLRFPSRSKESADDVGAQKTCEDNQEPLGGEKNNGSFPKFLSFQGF